MWFIAIILILIIQLSDFDLFVGISDLTKLLHHQCLNFTPESFHKDFYAALVCGNKLSSTEFSQNLKNLGIYHVIIVSGSHLIFLSVIAEKLFYSHRWSKIRYLIAPILILYSLTTGAEPPVVRALLSMGIDSFQKNKKLFWSQNEVIFISVLCCLALFDPWTTSYSLLLSYVASVTLSLTTDKNIYSKNIWIYFLILPFLLPLSAPNPLSFLTNMILAPIVGVVLFPLSIVSYLIPYFYRLVDPLWTAFLYICTKIGSELDPLHRYPIPLIVLWILAILLNFYGIYREKPHKENI